jgi:two-component system sensor histidine kinase TctE
MIGFKREQRSLFGEILDWMLTPLLLIWPVSLVLTWLVAQTIADKPFDRALEYNVQALAQLVTFMPGDKVQFNLPQQARELLRADDADQIYYQVLGLKGELVSGDKDIAPPTLSPRNYFGEISLRDDEIRGVKVRVASTWVDLGPAGSPQVAVQVAETRDKRSVLAAEIIKGVMLPQFVILPMAVLLVWLALARGLKPLNQLEARIRARKPDDLSALDDSAVPQEVVPLVMAVNDLLERLKDSVASQKRFLADAAHQLKTPLAGLRMQADLALRDSIDAEVLKHSLAQIGRSSMRATHTVNQLLALARADAGGHALVKTACDLAALVLEVVQDLVPKALDRKIDLGYEGVASEDPAGRVAGNATLLKELVRNLVDNAIHYTPSTEQRQGVVTVRLLLDRFGRALVLQIEDNGPGIPEAERELVLQPFYRALGTNADGSGLGLAIVQEIAQKHDSELSIQSASNDLHMPGALLSVRFKALAVLESL